MKNMKYATIIDHVAISNPSNVVESGVVKTCISDHYLVYVTRKFRGSIKANHKVITSRQLKILTQTFLLVTIPKLTGLLLYTTAMG